MAVIVVMVMIMSMAIMIMIVIVIMSFVMIAIGIVAVVIAILPLIMIAIIPVVIAVAFGEIGELGALLLVLGIRNRLAVIVVILFAERRRFCGKRRILRQHRLFGKRDRAEAGQTCDQPDSRVSEIDGHKFLPATPLILASKPRMSAAA
jgi:hypothetical protein